MAKVTAILLKGLGTLSCTVNLLYGTQYKKQLVGGVGEQNNFSASVWAEKLLGIDSGAQEYKHHW